MGNVTRDPELRHTPRGNAVLDLGMAVNRTYMAGDEKREEVTFVDVTFFSKPAETLAKYITKGRPLYVEGRLHMDQWEDKETGKKRSKLTVIGSVFQFIGEAKGSNGKPASIRQQADEADAIPF